MVLVYFDGRRVVKHPVEITLSSTCEVEGVGFPVPTRFALRLLMGEEDAWRLLKEVEEAPFSKGGKTWVLEAESVEEARRRLEEGLRNIPSGEPRFYKPLVESMYGLELTDGYICYRISLDNHYMLNLPINIYNYRESYWIDAWLKRGEYESIKDRPREFFEFLGRLLKLVGKRKTMKLLMKRLIHLYVRSTSDAYRMLEEAEKRAEVLNERDNICSAAEKPIRFNGGYLLIPKNSIRFEGGYIPPLNTMIIALDDGRVYVAEYSSEDSLKNAAYILVKHGKMPGKIRECCKEAGKAVWEVIRSELQR